MKTKDYLVKNWKSLMISLTGFMALAIGLALADIVVTNPEVGMLLGALSTFLVNFGRLTIGQTK